MGSQSVAPEELFDFNPTKIGDNTLLIDSVTLEKRCWKTLTDSQGERFRKLQSDEFKVDGDFSRP